MEDVIKFQDTPEKKESNTLQGGHLNDSVFQFSMRVGVRGRKKILIRRIIERALEQIAVQELPGIRASFIVEQKSQQGAKELAVQTDGVNFEILWHFADKMQLHRVSSTDLDATLRFYGVSGNLRHRLKLVEQL